MLPKRKLRIGVEGKALGKIQDGIGNVVCNLLDGMIRLEEAEFVVFSPYDALPENLEGRCSHVHGGPCAKNAGAWFYSGLPFLLSRASIDVFWEPRQILPVGIPSGIPSVMTIHDLAYLRFPETLTLFCRKNLELMGKRSIRKADFLVTVSDFTQAELKTLGLAPEGKPVQTVHNGVDSSCYFPDPFPPAGMEGRQYFLCVGSLEPRKNHDLLLSAFEETAAACKGNCPDLVLVYGNSWKSDALLDRVKRGPAAGKIHLFHGVSTETLRRLYSHALALVFPSLYEGFGLPILEAMACGCPVLAHDIPVFREVAKKAALFFGSRSEDLSQAMARIREPIQRQNLVDSGKARVANFSWERSARDMMDILTLTAERAGTAVEAVG